MIHDIPPDEPIITILLCQVLPAGETIPADMHWNTWISITPNDREAVTIDPEIRTSGPTLTITPTGWSWRDESSGVAGSASVDRATLRYKADYAGRRFVGQCRTQQDDET